MNSTKLKVSDFFNITKLALKQRSIQNIQLGEHLIMTPNLTKCAD